VLPRRAGDDGPACPNRDLSVLCYTRPDNPGCTHLYNSQGHCVVDFGSGNARSPHASAVAILIRTIFERCGPAEIARRIVAHIPIVVRRVMRRAWRHAVKGRADKTIYEVRTPPSDTRLVLWAHQCDVPVAVSIQAWIQQIRRHLASRCGRHAPNSAEGTRLVIWKTRNWPPFFYGSFHA